MVDPESKPRKNKPERGSQCLNCGLAINTNFCPNCGQHNTSHNHGLGQFFHEFLEEFLHFDSKIIRTLIPLVRHPGKLTQEWVVGKRVRYITPLKLYITLSAICILVISLKGTLYGQEKSDFKFNISKPTINKPISSSESSIDSLFRRKIGNPSQENMEAIKDKFISRLPTTNFVLMPVVAGIFSLLYIRRKRFYVEHLVFTLHYYSFIFLLITASSLLPPHFIISRVLAGLAVLWGLVYLPVALVRNYQQGYFKTLVKVCIFGVVYSFVLLMALFGTLVVTALALPDRPVSVETNSPAKIDRP